MRAARMHDYNQPLVLEEVPVPEPGPGEVLVKVAACGVCRSDWQLMEGYFRSGVTLQFPYIPGHEITGHIDRFGAEVPQHSGLFQGDLVVVSAGWGDGTCRQCHEGNEQLCTGTGGWVGFGPPGGYAEYVRVPYRHLIKVDGDPRPEYLAPLTDAGLTPYRGMKKLQAAGNLGAGRTVAVHGIGGLGSYGVQYAKLLGGGATVVALGRSHDKLAEAGKHGADHAINTRDKTAAQVQEELRRLTGRPDIDAILDCAGTESLKLGAQLLAAEGGMVSVGLMGTETNLSLFSFVSGERWYSGSFWGNHNDLTEVLALANAGHIHHTVTPIRYEDLNDRLEALARGDVVGRQVLVWD
ncbi:NAD(P)-dependent alcohol dehydrogenase [Dactylosporangium sp. CS-047395]|uniref:NAD(P)-dependent alcohol dehydrogenase n=1 Tax=Dactylosporangium sp. CS-047395 TaxID=3239936 RepID=UPI003D8EDEA3